LIIRQNGITLFPIVDNLTDIAWFVAVVERGSFTAAGDHLEVSKGAVSKAVSRLEHRLGARLLQRTTRRHTLTEAGEVLYRRATGALEGLDAAVAEVASLGGRPHGRLRVSAPVHYGETYLAPLLGDFHAAYPEVRVELDLSNAMVDLVRDRFDVALRITTPRDSTLVARNLAPVRAVTCASPAYLDRHGVPETPADLAHHACLGYTLDRTPSTWHYRRDGGSWTSVNVDGPFRCNNDGMLLRAAVDGVGILHMPDLFITQQLAAGTLVPVLEAYEGPELRLAAVFPTRANLAGKVRAFVDFVAARSSTR
jgi:DNA-binding transcriptional LysR family regulator